jgi:molecular chaperone DnaJ
MNKFIEDIEIPGGINNGQNIRVPGKGNFNEMGEFPGDLIIKINLKVDPYFKRDNYDIFTKLYLTISQAVLGHSVKVRTLEGEKDIFIQPGT